MRATRNFFMRIKSIRSAAVATAAFISAATVMSACGELTGPESPTTPSNVVATLASTTSANITWTPSPLNDGVISYIIYRNGTEVGESTTTSFTDTGLAQQTTYVYSVAANCKGGIVSDRSVETEASTVTTVDITRPTVIATSPANGATGVSRAGTATVTFSEPMDPMSITTANFNIRISASGVILAGTVTYNATTRVAEFVPSSPLPNLTQLTVTVTTGVKDLAGNTLATAFTSSWTTRDEDGPTVVVSPSNNAVGVSPSTLITATFSEAVDANTVNGTNLFLRVTGTTTNVAGTLAYNPTTRVATFTPTAPLAQSTSYTFTVTGVRDLQNNAMPAASVTTFTTGDLTAPTVTGVVPLGGAMNIATNTTVQITFSEAMDQTTINSTNIVLRNSGTSALVAATVTYNSTTNVATLTPTGPLSNATQYTLTVSTAVTDISNNPLASPFVSSFTTAPLPDNVAPTIISRTPAPGANAVATTTTVTVGFSEPMNATTINTTNIRLAPTSTPLATVAATVTYDPATRVATLTPTAQLASNTNYTVTVTGVQDAAGNPLGAQPPWTFTTAMDTTKPTVILTAPEDGRAGFPRDSVITVTFSEDMNPATLNGTLTNFTVRTTIGAIPVAGTVSYNTTTRIATFNPTGNLAASTSYTVTITSGATDLAGNGLAGNFTFTFTTGT
jgi:hypothetical protein